MVGSGNGIFSLHFIPGVELLVLILRGRREEVQGRHSIPPLLPGALLGIYLGEMRAAAAVQ